MHRGLMYRIAGHYPMVVSVSLGLCTAGQEIPACLAASAGVILRSATSCAACSRSRAVILHRGGRVGTHSVKVLRGHSWLSHLRRSLTQHRSTTSSARRTSRGRVTTVSCTRQEIVLPGQALAASQRIRGFVLHEGGSGVSGYAVPSRR